MMAILIAVQSIKYKKNIKCGYADSSSALNSFDNKKSGTRPDVILEILQNVLGSLWNKVE